MNLRPRLIRNRAALVAAAVLALGVGLAACGGATPPSAGGTSGNGTGSSGTGASSLLAYSVCMRAHGIPKFPDPSGKYGIPKDQVINAFNGVSSAKAASAQKACSHLLPSGSLSGQPSRTITAQDQQDYLKAVACMRTHGFPGIPDPTFANGQVQLNVPSSIDRHSTRFTRAVSVCARLIPAGLPYSSRSGT